MSNTIKMTARKLCFFSACMATALILIGCGDLMGGNDSRPATLSLSVQVPNAATGPAAKNGAGFFQSDGTNTLDIESVGIVLREIELERQFELDCDDEEDRNDDDFCEKIESGPFLLAPNLDGSLEHLITIDIPEGVYDELEFDVHKVNDDTAENRAFLNLHPEFDDLSIRVHGTFNGEVFVFTQDLMDEQEVDINPPIRVIGESAQMNVTMSLDLTTWFRTSAGMLLNPDSANKGGENENLVENNIKDSIDAFEDDDEDGERDHDD